MMVKRNNNTKMIKAIMNQMKLNRSLLVKKVKNKKSNSKFKKLLKMKILMIGIQSLLEKKEKNSKKSMKKKNKKLINKLKKEIKMKIQMIGIQNLQARKANNKRSQQKCLIALLKWQ
jgi:hypothetical protein